MPKGVMLSHENLLAGAKIVANYLRITHDDRLLAALPFSFDAGLNQLTTSVHQGGTLVLLDFLFGRDLVKSLDEQQITGFAGVPPLLSLLVQPSSHLIKHRFRRLRYVTNTGGKLPHHVLQELRAALPQTEIFLMYGLTEAFRSTYLPPGELDTRPDSIGKAIPDTEIMVINDKGKRCQPGEPGELVHRGPTVAMGYWGKPNETENVFRPNPYPVDGSSVSERVVYSGDLVRLDEEGFLFFEARRDNQIKVAGFRVSPTEIETVLCRHPAVHQAAVVGVPDDHLGQQIVGFVVTNETREMEAAKMIQFCAQNLPRHMIPKLVTVLDQLPRTASGKIDYVALQRQVSPSDSS